MRPFLKECLTTPSCLPSAPVAEGSSLTVSPADMERHSGDVTTELAVEIQDLLQVTQSPDCRSTTGLKRTREKLRQLIQAITRSSVPKQAKEEFRRLHGFEATLDALLTISFSTVHDEYSDQQNLNSIEVLEHSLSLLQHALRDHQGNLHYFSTRVRNGGWLAFEAALTQDELKRFISTSVVDETSFDLQRIFATLFAFCFSNEDLSDFFTDIDFKSAQQQSITTENSKTGSQESFDAGLTETTNDSNAEKVAEAVSQRITEDEIRDTKNAAALPSVFKLWLSIPRSGAHESHSYRALSLAILNGLLRIVRLSKHTAVAISHTKLVTQILETILFNFENPLLLDSEFATLQTLYLELVKYGMPNLEDAMSLYRCALAYETASNLFKNTIQASRQPRHFFFDLSIHGYASLELAQIKEPFPPDPSKGYTLMTWFCVENFDESCHTTLFGAFDNAQTCFMLLYLDSRRHELVLQTSMSHKDPSVRFKSVTFEAGKWYHIAIVHKRSANDSTSRAGLFVNGSFCEQVKCHYPAYARSPTSLTDASKTKHEQPSIRQAHVQAFIGTPEALAPRSKKGSVKLKWSLASLHYVAGVLPDDFIAVCERLGSGYSGNMQDCLGSFQTYTASALLNLRNELFNEGSENNSTMAIILRSKASKLNPERNILLSISPLGMSDEDETDTFKFKGTKFGGLELENYSNDKVYNAAVPKIADALHKPYGMALLTGGCGVVQCVSLEDTCWRLSGCVAMALELVESSRSFESLISNVEIFFELVQHSWRNSEAMERSSGFSVLAWLLRTKEVQLSALPGQVDAFGRLGLHRLLDLTLGFVGFNHQEAKESVIINPLAYRALLVDCDIWRKADMRTQETYYHQFSVFGTQSVHREFNAERLSRMRVVRRLLEALKGEPISVKILPSVLRALETLLKSTMSADVLRSLSLFITYALHIDEETFRKPILRHQGRLGTPDSNAKVRKDFDDRGNINSKTSDQLEVVSLKDIGIHVLKMLADILCNDSTGKYARRFARTVTNKWILFLLAVHDDAVVTSSIRILARLLVTSGPSYVSKFHETAGFTILSKRLRKLWSLDQLWTALFAILLGMDVSKLDTEIPFDRSYLSHRISSEAQLDIYCAQIFSVMASMLEQAMIDTKARLYPDIPQSEFDSYESEHSKINKVISSVVGLLQSLHAEVPAFHDFTITSDALTNVLQILYEAFDNIDQSNTEGFIELPAQKDSQSLVRESADINIDGSVLHRSSSFVVVKVADQDSLNVIPFERPLAPHKLLHSTPNLKSSFPQAVLDLATSMCVDRIMYQKEFPGIGLFLRAPPASDASRAYINSKIIVELLFQLEQEATLHLDTYLSTISLTNTARFVSQTCDGIVEGWLADATYALLQYLAALLLQLRGPETCRNKIVRLCSPSLSIMQHTFRRATIFYLSTVHEEEDAHTTNQFLLDLINWKELIFIQSEEDQSFLLSFCYLLFIKLMDTEETTRLAALNLWRSISLERPQAIYLTLADYSRENSIHSAVGRTLAVNFRDKAEQVLDYIKENRTAVDALFLGRPKAALTRRVKQENAEAQKTAEKRLAKRKERLEERHLADMAVEHAWTEHEVATGPWVNNICVSETYKQRRAKQDQSDSDSFMRSQFSKEKSKLFKAGIIQGDTTNIKWSLDESEGHDRRRLRLIPSKIATDVKYRPKRASVPNSTRVDVISGHGIDLQSRSLSIATTSNRREVPSLPGIGASDESSTPKLLTEDGFEVVVDTQSGDADLEDKNRKVMRSLQRGEKVLNVYNISRIAGLEACESLLIIGNLAIYLISHHFQRSDGEVVNTWQAPEEERDPYTRIISGNESNPPFLEIPTDEEDVRHWPWESIISVSKRQFLLRNVGLEVFFQDGRSYLLTAHSVAKRDELHDSLLNKIQALKLSRAPEDVWRTEMLPNAQDTLATVGARLTQVFNSGSSYAATKQWVKGELSNFQYLMLVNTMAGRTFNDLTQYPVFPWVLSDYTSEELDLSNPRVYRDLSKPMGCQSVEREQTFRQRFNDLKEMIDDQTPSFHYGTHYSSAMIVTSYLIRLQPFVRAYLLLQGGTFDHAERLFSSIEKAWISASKESMSDVRELTPEFFYLPDFLQNINAYNFGRREGGEIINDVKLPPWAKGDPNIFIQKQREALESPYVSQNLHHWIDLVFGFKQRGEAALEAVNLFHYLSYQGAKDLDTISDPLERRATIGIIHNFGQTPRQVFNRPHDRRNSSTKTRRLDRSIDFLTRLPNPFLKAEEPIVTLKYSHRYQRVLHGFPGEAIMPGESPIIASSAYTDRSLRFYSSNQRILMGVFEQPSQAVLAVVAFADPKTLLTASTDCTICVWGIEIGSNTVDLQSQGNLFGHRQPIIDLIVSRALSTVLSVDETGRVIIWDLNRLDLVREINVGSKISCAQINNINGHILLCSGQKMYLYTLNGQKLLEQTAHSAQDDHIFSCAFYEGSGREWIEHELIFTGHNRGNVNVWRLDSGTTGQWRLDLIRRLEHVDRASSAGNYLAPITCILPRDQQLYTGDKEGRVFEWTCVR